MVLPTREEVDDLSFRPAVLRLRITTKDTEGALAGVQSSTSILWSGWNLKKVKGQ